MNKIKFAATATAAVLAVWILVKAPSGAAQTKVETAGQKFKSIRVLNDMPADQMGKVMNMMSASLGVDCKVCHASNDGDYDKEGNENKDTARKMMRMMFDLNKANFNGRPEINCNTCHNGRSHPQPSFPLGVAAKQAERPVQPATRPAGDQIAAKFEAAIGATSAKKIGPLKITGIRLEPDGKTTEPETIWIKDGKYAAETLYGSNAVKEIFDGTRGRKFAGVAEVELKPDEAEQIKRDAELLTGVSLKTIYTKLEFRAVDRIDGRDVNVVFATKQNNLRERLSFDVATGLLVRRTASTPTLFGNFVYQVDYADYKPFNGIKMPTTIHYSVPHISWTRKITAVKAGPVDDPVFTAAGK